MHLLSVLFKILMHHLLIFVKQSEQIRIDSQSNNYPKTTKLYSQLFIYLYDIALSSVLFYDTDRLLPKL